MEPPAKSSRPYYGNLEALRGIAAALVVLHHLALRPGTIIAGNQWLAQGWLFVDLFFVLSGFVIASAHARSAADGPTAGGFLIRRLFRLYPLHAATLLAALMLDIADSTAALPGYGWMVGLNLALVHSWGFVPGGALNAPSWSISVEWAAYCLFAAVCLGTASVRHRMAAMAVVGAVSAVLIIVYCGGALDGDLTFRLPRCLMSFSLGVLAWGWLRDRPPLGPRTAALGQLGAGAVMLGLPALVASVPAAAMAMPLASAAMVAFMVRDPGSVARRLLDCPAPQWLGRHSYSLYLVHMPLFEASLRLGGRWLVPNLWLVLALAALAGVSALTYRWIEAPFRDLGRRLARRTETSTRVGKSLQLI